MIFNKKVKCLMTQPQIQGHCELEEEKVSTLNSKCLRLNSLTRHIERLHTETPFKINFMNCHDSSKMNDLMHSDNEQALESIVRVDKISDSTQMEITRYKDTEFVSYKNLDKEVVREHLKKPIKLFVKDHDITTRGRKRKQATDSITECYPNGFNISRSKPVANNAKSLREPRSDTMWKKILRDAREFFRILFQNRFHALEFKDSQDVLNCIKNLYDNLGIRYSENDFKDFRIFCYFHQTHRYTASKLFVTRRVKQTFTPFEMIENYNEINLLRFLKHPLCSRMLYFVYANYSNNYYPIIKDEYKDQVVILIKGALNCYRKMKSYRHINRIEFWI